MCLGGAGRNISFFFLKVIKNQNYAHKQSKTNLRNRKKH